MMAALAVMICKSRPAQKVRVPKLQARVPLAIGLCTEAAANLTRQTPVHYELHPQSQGASVVD